MTPRPSDSDLVAAMPRLTAFAIGVTSTVHADDVDTVLAALASAQRDGKRLDWLERFLQLGGSSVFTSFTGEAMKDEDFQDDGVWSHPFCVGYTVEMENRGCYRWEEKAGGEKRLRTAIDAAMSKEPPR